MSDLIATLKYGCTCAHGGSSIPCVRCKAADEIERLTAELKQYKLAKVVEGEIFKEVKADNERLRAAEWTEREFITYFLHQPSTKQKRILEAFNEALAAAKT